MYELKIYKCRYNKLFNCKECNKLTAIDFCKKYKLKFFRFKFLAEFYAMLLCDGFVFEIRRVKEKQNEK